METKFYDKDVLRKLQMAELEILKDYIAVCEKHGLPYFVSGGTAIGVLRHKGFIPWDDDIDVCMLRPDYDRFMELAEKELGDKYDILQIVQTKAYVMELSKISKKNTTFVEATDTNRKYHSGIFIDVFPYDEVSPEPKQRAKQYRRTWLWARLNVLTEYKDPKLPAGLSPFLKRIAAFACVAAYGVLKLFRVKIERTHRGYLRQATRHQGSGYEYYTDFTYENPELVWVKKDEIFPLRKGMFEGIEVSVLNGCEAYLTRQFGDYMVLPPVEQQHNHYPAELDFDK